MTILNDTFDYFLPSNQEPYILLKIITYDIHNARIIANKLRFQNNNMVLSQKAIEYETDLKNLDCKLISGIITYNEYLIEYRKLETLDTNIRSNLFNAKIRHINFINEFVNMKTHLKLN